MGENTKYGYCKNCKLWVPRDEMLSINCSVYDAKNEEQKIRLRFCPPCQGKIKEMLENLGWDGVLKLEKDIRVDERLSSKSDIEFDDSEEAMRKSGVLKDSLTP